MKIVNFKKIEKGIMQASFDVVIEEWGITIKKCLLFDKGGNRWVSFPSTKVDLDDGSTKYYPYIYMEKAKKEKFDAKVLDLLDSGKFEMMPDSPQKPAPAAPSSSFDDEVPF